MKLSASTPIAGGTFPVMHREVSVNADGTFTLIGMPPSPIEISADHCDTCGFFTLRRVEFPKRDSSKEMQLAEQGWTDSHRLINVDRNIQGMRVVLVYNGGSIRCNVNVIGTLPPGLRLMISVDSGIGRGGWSGWREVDANGQMLSTGLEPGNYSLKVGDGSRHFTETKRVTVTKNREAKVSFTIDASRIQKLR